MSLIIPLNYELQMLMSVPKTMGGVVKSVKMGLATFHVPVHLDIV